MTYPPGMTREHWNHIDGEAHYPTCPMHEDSTCGGVCRIGDCECAQIEADLREEAELAKGEQEE